MEVPTTPPPRIRTRMRTSFQSAGPLPVVPGKRVAGWDEEREVDPGRGLFPSSAAGMTARPGAAFNSVGEHGVTLTIRIRLQAFRVAAPPVNDTVDAALLTGPNKRTAVREGRRVRHHLGRSIPYEDRPRRW